MTCLHIWKIILRLVQTRAFSFLKSMSERGGSDLERLSTWMKSAFKIDLKWRHSKFGAVRCRILWKTKKICEKKYLYLPLTSLFVTFFRITKEKLLTLRTKDKVPLYNYEYLCNMFYVWKIIIIRLDRSLSQAAWPTFQIGRKTLNFRDHRSRDHRTGDQWTEINGPRPSDRDQGSRTENLKGNS